LSTINNNPILFFGVAKVVNNQLRDTYMTFFFNSLLANGKGVVREVGKGG
jgi:hypothetical protein